MVLIEIPREYNIQKKLKYCCGLSIKTDSLRVRKGESQCYRCQRFGHVQQNCNAEFKCLKCAGKHQTFTCEKPITTDATCANCGGDHPANYSKCPNNPNFIKTTKRLIAPRTWSAMQPTKETTVLAEKPTQPRINPPVAPELVGKDQRKPSTEQQEKKKANRNQIISEMLMDFVKKNPTEEEQLNFMKKVTLLINSYE